MISRGTLIWSSLAVVAAVGVFLLKFEVQEKAGTLAAIEREIRETEEALTILEAEWAYRNRPDRLKRLVEKHLDLQPVNVEQMDDIDAVPVKFVVPDATSSKVAGESE